LLRPYDVNAESRKGLKVKKSSQVRFTVNQAWCIAGCICFFIFASILTIIPDVDYFVYSSAITDLSNGSAKTYGDALKERAELYQSGEKNIVVKPLATKPELLFFSDISTDAGNWENRGLCRFYGLESVIREKEQQEH